MDDATLSGIRTATAELLTALRSYENNVIRSRPVDRDEAIRWLTPINPPLAALHDLLRDIESPTAALTWNAFGQESDRQHAIELLRRTLNSELYALPMLAGNVSMCRLFPLAWERELPSFSAAIGYLENALEMLGKEPAARNDEPTEAEIKLGRDVLS